MAEIVNLRTVRKRAARDKAENLAAEKRVAHGTSRSQRAKAKVERDKADQTLDRHRLETGDRR